MVPQTIAIRQSRDKAIHISESVLTDLLLDNSGLNRQERLMVLTAMQGSSATKDAEASLIKMHNRIHTSNEGSPQVKVDVARTMVIPERETKAGKR